EMLASLVSRQTAPERYFKKTRRRIVMQAGRLIVKLYEFHGLSDLLHSKRYGSREVECYHDYLQAFGSHPGFRLPSLFGYFEKTLPFGFFRANGIVDEFIPGARLLTIEELPLTPPMFAHLYRKGIYHPDMQFQNTLWHEESQTIVPIDYMGCNFLPAPNHEALLIMMARFLKTGAVEESPGRQFVESVLTLLPEVALDHQKAWHCVQALCQTALETHQYHHPIFLTPKMRRMLE
ncbi:MAG: hypothetical protein IJJ33_05670, partial [Victivallales bacterium]|nr:hypothetical protein [Victivallales bacterium]